MCEEISRGDSRQNFAQNLSESVSRNFAKLEKISYNFVFREKGKPNFVATLPGITRCLEEPGEVLERSGNGNRATTYHRTRLVSLLRKSALFSINNTGINKSRLILSAGTIRETYIQLLFHAFVFFGTAGHH